MCVHVCLVVALGMSSLFLASRSRWQDGGLGCVNLVVLPATWWKFCSWHFWGSLGFVLYCQRAMTVSSEQVGLQLEFTPFAACPRADEHCVSYSPLGEVCIFTTHACLLLNFRVKCSTPQTSSSTALCALQRVRLSTPRIFVPRLGQSAMFSSPYDLPDFQNCDRFKPQ